MVIAGDRQSLCPKEAMGNNILEGIEAVLDKPLDMESRDKRNEDR